MSDTSTPQAFDRGDLGFVLIATALVWFMIPGIGLFYSGLAGYKSSVSLILLTLLSISVTSIQWWAYGFSLTYSDTGGAFIGDFRYALFQGVDDSVSASATLIPQNLLAINQGMLAALTPALAISGTAERGRIFPAIVFIWVWSTLVYDIIAYWVWSNNGWGNLLGVLDFGGGIPIHIAAGSTALVYSILLGKGTACEPRSKNVQNVIIGTVMLWLGWFGLNGGSALAMNARAINACIVTNLAASTGALTWLLIDIWFKGKISAISFCCGAVSGLTAITPGSGFVEPTSAFFIGIVGAIACNFSSKMFELPHFDQSSIVFSINGVGGIVGTLLTAVFAQRSIAVLDGTQIPGGWMDRNWVQLAYQLAMTCAAIAWSCVVSLIILSILNFIPYLRLRIDPESEKQGLDESQTGESICLLPDTLVAANVRTGLIQNLSHMDHS